ncbi:hypothetical protein C0995_009281 [Termitomyces sp. Mi166|nr:hypothetical protein C0995_009281 [Termitomyces sp. Mi166\
MFPNRATPGPYDFGVAKDQEWFVNDLLGHRWTDKGHLEFEVRWSLGDTTWEPLESCRKLAALDSTMLPAWAEYVQYMHSVDEALLQHLERAGQPVPATAAFLQDDLAVMVVEGLLDQIELMKRQRVSALEQIECVGKHKAPTFEELIVEPKRARAPSQHPQELAWAPAHTVA